MTRLRIRWSPSLRPTRPRAVWAAVITSAVLCVATVPVVLLPVLTLVGTAAGFTVGAVHVPVGQIVLALLVGYVLALGLLVLAARSRSGPLSWVLGVAAVIACVLVSLWPLPAVAIAAVHEARDVVPFIQHLVGRVLQR